LGVLHLIKEVRRLILRHAGHDYDKPHFSNVLLAADYISIT
jgi:hypothetical protein